MAMLLRTSRRNIALRLRIVCLLTVTLTFVIIAVISGERQHAVGANEKEIGNY